jgi:hypothetical protein
MSVLDKLASALGRNDERPNVELAQALASKPDHKAIAELIEALSTGTTAQQNDAIKVLYELGDRAPELVTPHTDAFLALLNSKNNRNVWGAMQALDAVAQQNPDAVFAALPQILVAADRGSVIAKDKAMSILTQLASVGLASEVMPVFLARLETSVPNQFPMYAEFGALVMDDAHKDAFVSILLSRVGKLAPAKRARVEKVLRKLSKS